MAKGVLWTDVAQVIIVALQLLVLAIAAVVAWRQVKEARKLREQQSRPFVVIDFELEGSYLVFLEVSNLGNSLARNVRFDIQPPLESASKVPVGKLKMLNEGISTLAPGKRIRTFFDMGFRRGKSDLPMTYKARVQYTDQDGDRHFDEELDLDLDLFMHLSTITRHGLHDIHERLKEIRDVYKGWSRTGGRGLVAMTPEQLRAENERIVAELEAHDDEAETDTEADA